MKQNITVESKGGGIGFLGLLTIVFVTLKLTGVIAWSWWAVTSPLWAIPAIILAFVLMVFVMALCGIAKK